MSKENRQNTTSSDEKHVISRAAASFKEEPDTKIRPMGGPETPTPKWVLEAWGKARQKRHPSNK